MPSLWSKSLSCLADGVTCGFNRKQLTESMLPPTIPSTTSPCYESVRPPKMQTLVSSPVLRKTAIALVEWRMGLSRKATKKRNKRGERIEDSSGDTTQSAELTDSRLSSTIAGLHAVHPLVGDIFSTYVSAATSGSSTLTQLYLSLLRQVGV